MPGERRRRGFAWVLPALVMLGSGSAAALPRSPRSADLSATCLGTGSGAAAKLAVSWSGVRAAQLTVWVDRDRDGRRDAGEPSLAEQRIDPGITVLELDARRSANLAVEARSRIGRRQSAVTATCGWATEFEHSDLVSRALTSAVYDDGHGPALYVGGWFHIAGSEEVWGIAKWDGRSWSAVRGPGGSGVWGGAGAVFTMVVFDDGNGPALYVGGWFSWAGWVPTRNIARWNGREWSAVSGTTTSSGLSGEVYSLAVFDDGTGPALFAAGDFQWAGTVWVSYIARWNGSSWSALSGPSGTGLNARAGTLAVFDDGSGPALYVAGGFSTAGGIAARGIARWNGSSWSPVSGPSGNGIQGAIAAFAVFDDGTGPALYAGGLFTMAGGVPARSVAKWTRSGWAALSSQTTNGTNGFVKSLLAVSTRRGPSLIAAGEFTEAGGVAVGRIAEWDGRSWSTIAGLPSAGLDDTVNTLALFDDGLGTALFAGGVFRRAGDVAVNYIAKWNGAEWSSLSGPSGVGPNSGVQALTAWDDGHGPALVAGGRFVGVGELSAARLARWDGRSWSVFADELGEGVSDDVNALAIFDDGSGPALFVGGWFDAAGGRQIFRLAKWDGETWSSVGANPPWVVRALVVHDDGSGPALYAGGEGISLGVGDVNPVQKWNGQTWSVLPGFATSQPNSSPVVFALTSFDDGSGPALYAGGRFEQAGGVPANHIAKWDGTTWTPLAGPAGNGVDDWVLALAVRREAQGEALYAGGMFLNAGGTPASRVARWDGHAWSALSGPSGNGVNAPVYALTSLGAGAGSQLFAGGDFTQAGGTKVDHVARWDGATWSALEGPFGEGVSSRVYALAAFDDGSGPAIWVGGNFASAGAIGSSYLARWQCRVPFSFHDGFESGSASAWSLHLP